MRSSGKICVMPRTGAGTLYQPKTLGADYTEEAIRERIAGKRTRAAKAPKAERRGVNLLIDIEKQYQGAAEPGL